MHVGRIKASASLRKITSVDEAEGEESDLFDNKFRTIVHNSSGSSSGTGSATSSGSCSKSDKDSWISPTASSSSNSRGGWVNRRAGMGTTSVSSDGLSRSMRGIGGSGNMGSSISRPQSEKYDPDKYVKVADNSTRSKSEKYEPDKFAKLAESSSRRHSAIITSPGSMYVHSFLCIVIHPHSFNFLSLSLHSLINPFMIHPFPGPSGPTM